MPKNHKNVKPVSYITSPIKIGEYLSEKIMNYITKKLKKIKMENGLYLFFVGYQKGDPSKILQKNYK